jgi:hypothetical protein
MKDGQGLDKRREQSRAKPEMAFLSAQQSAALDPI